MNRRPDNIQAFIDTAAALFSSPRLSDGARTVAGHVFARLQSPSDDGVRHRARLPACSWVDVALAACATSDATFAAAAGQIKALEGELGWSRRTSGVHGSENYADRHVHGMICGPGGAESRYDVQLGFSVMAPHVRYPDHSHPPEEAYVLCTAGQFKQDQGEWFDPGIGGGIHNARGQLHAMRSISTPFLAIWCLLT
jgi:hypothetical protein